MTNLPIFSAATAEIFVLIMACVILIVDLFLSEKNKIVTYLLSQLTLIIVFIISASQFGDARIITFHDEFVLDNLAILLKLAMYVALFFVFWYSRSYNGKAKILKGEFHLLALLSMLGGMVLVSSNTLLTVYLGLELLSLPLYAMVAMSRSRADGSEAAMKYFVMGAIASGLLLYGMSLVYGMTGSIDLSVIAHAAVNSQTLGVYQCGMVLMVCAIAFKMGAVPFHMWAPDVYQGSPTSVTIYLATVPKLAGFGMMLRLIIFALVHMKADWTVLLSFLGVISLFGGTVMALVQTNIKRLFAYSTIANVGFIFIALGIGSKESLDSALFYTLVYVMTTVGAFGLLLLMSRAGVDAETISDLTGLNKRNAWHAAMMMLLLFSMAGIPPLLGFDAKLLVISHLVNASHYYMAIFALLMSVIGAYYYLRVVKVMYFDAPKHCESVRSPWDMTLALSVNGLAVLVLGLFPAGLMAITQMALS